MRLLLPRLAWWLLCLLLPGLTASAEVLWAGEWGNDAMEVLLFMAAVLVGVPIVFTVLAWKMAVRLDRDLNRAFGVEEKKLRPRGNDAARPSLEVLEDRSLLTAQLIGGLLDVRSAGGTVAVVRDAAVTTVYENNVQTFRAANEGVSSAVVRGSKLADVVQIVGNLPAVVSTYDGDDLVFIGTGPAVIDMGDGKDVGYSILSANRVIDRDADADFYFSSPAGKFEGDVAEDQKVVFFQGAATPGSPFVGVDSSGTLLITTGDQDSDVRIDAGKDARGRDTTVVTYDFGGGEQSLSFHGVRNIAYFGGLGDDAYLNNTKRSEAAYGGLGGNDTLEGGHGKVSVLKGLSDDDVLKGRAQRNVLQGGAGADLMTVSKPGKVPDVYFVDLVFGGDVIDAGRADFVSAP